MMNILNKLFRRDSDTSHVLAPAPSTAAETVEGKMRVDNPIHTIAGDTLGRDAPAIAFTEQIISLDATRGLVVGVLGPWGSGKTSFINLTRTHLQDAGIIVIDFNPWMFSGEQQLVEFFFNEIAAQLRVLPSMGEVGEAIDQYGEIFSGLGWLPFAGAWIERGKLAKDIVAGILKGRKEGVNARKDKVTSALEKLENPLIVVVDDIDRLSTQEIRDVFKLVRLTANFPNMIYVVAFDRNRVETALQEEGIPGRDYLEKILQLAIDLPILPSGVLDKQIFEALDEILDSRGDALRFNKDLWSDIFVEVIRPLIRNMRDVRRYAVAVAGAVKQLDGQIEGVDILGIEAIRTFVPDVFAEIPNALNALTSPSETGSLGSRRPEDLRAQIEKLIAKAGDNGGIVRRMIHRIFLSAQWYVGGSHYGASWFPKWLQDRRLAHPDILQLYLERTVGEGLRTFMQAENAWEVFSDPDGLNKYFHTIDAIEWEKIISALEGYENDFRPEHVVPGIVTLLNLWPEIPERPRGFLEFGTRLTITRVTYRLIRSLKDPQLIEDVTREILPQLSTLSAKLELITDLGHKPEQGHKLVPEDVATALEAEWRDEVVQASEGDILREIDPIRVLLVAKLDAKAGEQTHDVSDSPELTLKLLESARSETISQTLESRSVRRSPRLAWKALVDVFGSEELLITRIENLKATKPSGIDDLLDLVNRYATGNAPSDMNDIDD